MRERLCGHRGIGMWGIRNYCGFDFFFPDIGNKDLNLESFNKSVSIRVDTFLMEYVGTTVPRQYFSVAIYELSSISHLTRRRIYLLIRKLCFTSYCSARFFDYKKCLVSHFIRTLDCVVSIWCKCRDPNCKSERTSLIILIFLAFTSLEGQVVVGTVRTPIVVTCSICLEANGEMIPYFFLAIVYCISQELANAHWAQ